MMKPLGSAVFVVTSVDINPEIHAMRTGSDEKLTILEIGAQGRRYSDFFQSYSFSTLFRRCIRVELTNFRALRRMVPMRG
jgi:hypothetical protein